MKYDGAYQMGSQPTYHHKVDPRESLLIGLQALDMPDFTL